MIMHCGNINICTFMCSMVITKNVTNNCIIKVKLLKEKFSVTLNKEKIKLIDAVNNRMKQKKKEFTTCFS